MAFVLSIICIHGNRVYQLWQKARLSIDVEVQFCSVHQNVRRLQTISTRDIAKAKGCARPGFDPDQLLCFTRCTTVTATVYNTLGPFVQRMDDTVHHTTY